MQWKERSPRFWCQFRLSLSCLLVRRGAKITDAGGGRLHVDVEGAFHYAGWGIADPTKPNRGGASIVECHTNPNDPTDNEIASFSVTLKPTTHRPGQLAAPREPVPAPAARGPGHPSPHLIARIAVVGFRRGEPPGRSPRLHVAGMKNPRRLRAASPYQ